MGGSASGGDTGRVRGSGESGREWNGEAVAVKGSGFGREREAVRVGRSGGEWEWEAVKVGGRKSGNEWRG